MPWPRSRGNANTVVFRYLIFVIIYLILAKFMFLVFFVWFLGDFVFFLEKILAINNSSFWPQFPPETKSFCQFFFFMFAFLGQKKCFFFKSSPAEMLPGPNGPSPHTPTEVGGGGVMGGWVGSHPHGSLNDIWPQGRYFRKVFTGLRWGGCLLTPTPPKVACRMSSRWARCSH